MLKYITVSNGVVSNGVEWCGVKWCQVSVMTLESLVACKYMFEKKADLHLTF